MKTLKLYHANLSLKSTKNFKLPVAAVSRQAAKRQAAEYMLIPVKRVMSVVQVGVVNVPLA
jgi:hypothetical protein